jgi:phosphomannomutase
MKRLMEESAVKFGTSGARGLVTDMTDGLLSLYCGLYQYLESRGQFAPG